MSEATEIGYGGAAGGGKSHLGRISAIYFSYAIPGLNTYLFRRKRKELIKNHMEGPTSFPAMLGPWIRKGYVRIVRDEIRFANGPEGKFDGGSRIFLCYCQYEKDVFDWLGPEMHYLILEQAEQFTPFTIKMLRGRNRIPNDLNIPQHLKPLFPRCLYTFNPGGPGHQFFKQDFVRAREPYKIEQVKPEEGGKKRQFIPAKLHDNPSINPDEYKNTLMGLPVKMRKALLDGDFDVVIGAFFPTLSRDKHLIKPFMIPNHWPRFMSMDWGACGDGDPFSIGWYTVSDGTIPIISSTTGERHLAPRGSLICYRRWNGSGLPKVTALEVSKGIKEREHEAILFRVAGGDILEQRGHGESIFAIFAGEGLQFKRADMRRQNGWAQVDHRLVGEDHPLSYWFEEAQDDLETISSLQHDLHDPNDVAKGDDHDADRHRYACMTRPLALVREEKKEEQIDYASKNERVTISSLVEQLNRPEVGGYITRR